jgi:hypothetical protein
MFNMKMLSTRSSGFDPCAQKHLQTETAAELVTLLSAIRDQTFKG